MRWNEMTLLQKGVATALLCLAAIIVVASLSSQRISQHPALSQVSPVDKQTVTPCGEEGIAPTPDTQNCTLTVAPGIERIFMAASSTLTIVDPSGAVAAQSFVLVAPSESNDLLHGNGADGGTTYQVADAGDINFDGYADIQVDDLNDDLGNSGSTNVFSHFLIFDPKTGSYSSSTKNLFPDADGSNTTTEFFGTVVFSPASSTITVFDDLGWAGMLGSVFVYKFTDGAYRNVYRESMSAVGDDDCHQTVKVLQKDGTWKVLLDKTYESCMDNKDISPEPYLDEVLRGWPGVHVVSSSVTSTGATTFGPYDGHSFSYQGQPVNPYCVVQSNGGPKGSGGPLSLHDCYADAASIRDVHTEQVGADTNRRVRYTSPDDEGSYDGPFVDSYIIVGQKDSDYLVELFDGKFSSVELMNLDAGILADVRSYGGGGYECQTGVASTTVDRAHDALLLTQTITPVDLIDEVINDPDATLYEQLSADTNSGGLTCLGLQTTSFDISSGKERALLSIDIEPDSLAMQLPSSPDEPTCFQSLMTRRTSAIGYHFSPDQTKQFVKDFFRQCEPEMRPVLK